MATPLNGQRSHNTRLLRSRNVPSLASLSVSHSSPFHSYRSNTYRYVPFSSSKSVTHLRSKHGLLMLCSSLYEENNNKNIPKTERRDDDDVSQTRRTKNQKQHCKNDSTYLDSLPKHNNCYNEELSLGTHNNASDEQDDYFSIKLEESLHFYKRSIKINYTNIESIYNEDNYFERNNNNNSSIINEYAYDRNLYPNEEISSTFTNILTKIFQSLTNTSLEESESMINGMLIIREHQYTRTPVDPCDKWLINEDRLKAAFMEHLTVLPSCPCIYPNFIFYDNQIWDEKQNRHYRWRDVSTPIYRLDVYKPGASYCVRTLLGMGALTVSAQHCCYDKKRKLITRGSGAGIPYYVSPEVSMILHEKIDILPWRLCKGDFSRFNEVRTPNNDKGCRVNPKKKEYQRQLNSTKDF
ncbi:PREDICTED: uncharacterized protein LOC107068762 isoform X2 [Polistes dominula]|nr:PREDICTED: uncharacterized protein LOC107068762 isoform X2 [Polistes dominula]